jgi:hypothetical protein
MINQANRLVWINPDNDTINATKQLTIGSLTALAATGGDLFIASRDGRLIEMGLKPYRVCRRVKRQS